MNKEKAIYKSLRKIDRLNRLIKHFKVKLKEEKVRLEELKSI